MEIYGDLLKPGVTQVGKALGTSFGLTNTLLLPLTLINEKARLIMQKNLEKYRSQLESIPEDQIVDVPPEIGVPLIERLTYVTDEEISDLYINLLAKASTVSTSRFAHPSFTHNIDSLSPDEALLIKVFITTSELAYIDVNLAVIVSGEYDTLLLLLTGLENKIQMLYPDNCAAYFSNFTGLGILTIRHDTYISDESLYKRLGELYDEQIKAIQYNINEKRIEIRRGIIKITPYGRLFISACVKKLNEI